MSDSTRINSGRVAVVLGGSGDIGSAIAHSLAAEGFRIVIVGRDVSNLQEVASEIKVQSGVDVLHICADLTAEDTSQTIVDQVIGKLGRIDILVTAAAEFKQGTLVDLSAKDWADGFAAMFFGAVNVVKAAWPHLMKRKGQVILITGVFAIRPRAAGTLASAIAGALLNFSKSAAEQGMRDGVTVNSVLPGPVAGRRFDKQLERFARTKGIGLDEARGEYARQLGVDRVASPDEVGKLVAFLTSEANSFMRGASIVIDGGMSRAL